MVRKRLLRRLVHLKSCWIHKATYVNYSRYIIYLKVWLKLKCKWIIFSCDDHTFLVMFSITCIACSVSWNKMFIFVRKVFHDNQLLTDFKSPRKSIFGPKCGAFLTRNQNDPFWTLWEGWLHVENGTEWKFGRHIVEKIENIESESVIINVNRKKCVVSEWNNKINHCRKLGWRFMFFGWFLKCFEPDWKFHSKHSDVCRDVMCSMTITVVCERKREQ